jgi:hypothetical protein
MPKTKKIRSNALGSQEVRHEPLGQVIEGDSMRGKYAAPSRGRQKMKKADGEEEFLDQKSSQIILDMTKDQQNQVDMEEVFDRQRRQTQQTQGIIDSDDEDDVEVEEVVIDEEDE